jgi:hypothetical protein
VKDIPADRHAWLVVQGSGHDYYPQASIDLPPSGDGTWGQNVRFGGEKDSKKAFILHVVDADDTADRRFRDYVKQEQLASEALSEALSKRQRPPMSPDFPGPLLKDRSYPEVRNWASVTVVRQ